MSKQNRAGPPAAPASAGGGGAGVPVPVAQQAQQYLEENIKAWMQQPVAQGCRENIQPLPLTMTTANPPEAHHHHQRPPPPPQPHRPQEHQRAAAHREPPLSPSSGYSEHSDPYAGLGLSGSAEAFPHSLSFGGCSQHSLLQGTSYSTPCGNSANYGVTQPSAAASFFARAAQRLNLSAKKKRRPQLPLDPERQVFRTNFRDVIKNQPPPVPPGLLRIAGRKDAAAGKVKVMLRMCPPGEADASYMTLDARKKQVTLFDPTVGGPAEGPGEARHAGVAAPKMFAFDAVFAPDDNQAEVCSSSLCDVISSVVGGSDGCLFVYGHSKLGKTSTMVGNSNSLQELGVIPCAIWWLFRAINEQKHRTGARFSVRVSAVEVTGKVEELRDLLADYAAPGAEGTAPGVYLRDDPVFGSQLVNQSELRAPTAERAAFLLDAALAARTSESEEDARNAHFLFTLHVYQYRVEKGGRGGVAGGRSRLHLFDLGGCEKTSKAGGGGCLSLSALGNVILALFNGQKHVPYKESKLTQLLREAVGSVMCRAAMIAHVSTAPARYPETLATLQLASRIHRLRRKKLKFSSTADAAAGDDKGGVCRPFVRIHAVGEDGEVKSGSSDKDYTSSSEQSCDTVIFVGAARAPSLGPLCDRQPSPLAKETSSSPARKPVTSKSSSHHPQEKNLPTASSSSTLSKDLHKSSDHVSKSALNSNEQLRMAVGCGAVASPKKKALTSSAHSSPKHQISSAANSPKMSKYVMMEYPVEGKRIKSSSDSPSKSSPLRVSKANISDNHQKSANVPPSSLTASPQSQRKSKRSHKQQDALQQDVKPLTKEPKPSSDETWIDGPRFTKPKFDSRTLHQLQKEKWVDGPGMYGYMDVQKETMIRRWVEDHSRVAPEAKADGRKEVWIDFPPDAEEKSATSKHLSSEKPKKDAKAKSSDQSTSHQIVVDVETHHYAKPITNSNRHQPQIQSGDNIHVSNRPKEEKKDVAKSKQQSDLMPFVTDLENSINGNLSEIFEKCSIRSSNSSLDFNDNSSEDLGLDTKEGQTDRNLTEDFVPMVDSSIQVTEEDIFTTCGWPREMFADNHFSDTDSYEGVEHPLHVLSAEGLNLASSFTDSRAVSVDFDSMSVPEAWTADDQDMDPDLTWKLLRGGSLPHRTNHSTRSINVNENCRARNDILASKLERLANLREMIERSSRKKKEMSIADNLGKLYGPDYRVFAKLHHSADSSLEELRDNDANSIHSEPAELDVEKFDFQFNVKPMNGLRLEAFYNKIQKVPLFPDSFTQFGKPTQVVPPIIKKQTRCIKVPIDDLKVFQRTFDTQYTTDDPIDSSTLKTKYKSIISVNSKIDAIRQIPEGREEQFNVRNSRENIPTTERTESPLGKTQSKTNCVSDRSHNSTEIVQEQRCRVPSEPTSTHVAFHSSPRCFGQKMCSKSKNNSENNSPAKTAEESRHDTSFLIKQHQQQRKKGSPKLPPRGIMNSYRSPQKTKSYLCNNPPSVPIITMSPHESQAACVSSSVSWTLAGGAVTTSHPASTPESHILSRSTSTPTSPFMNNNGYVCSPSTSSRKDSSKWLARQSSSGHGSDSSVVSSDVHKECKELLGSKLSSKTKQFSGTSSGYESMPRDSEGTPLSSSSQESSSEVGAKKESRGRKGTRKKTQGFSKRSRSVPARPPVTANSSPTWQQPPAVPVARQQMRGRLVRDLHDPNLWKSEEDVCCTSLLCCRLLDFY